MSADLEIKPLSGRIDSVGYSESNLMRRTVRVPIADQAFQNIVIKTPDKELITPAPFIALGPMANYISPGTSGKFLGFTPKALPGAFIAFAFLKENGDFISGLDDLKGAVKQRRPVAKKWFIALIVVAVVTAAIGLFFLSHGVHPLALLWPFVFFPAPLMFFLYSSYQKTSKPIAPYTDDQLEAMHEAEQQLKHSRN